ncbi:MAG: Flp pilus assembly complex ATPase component [Proteobacteria bacterium]|nr:Flp pilus assembly complex ATPase component [Pseudomonadota bacterium]
MEKTVTIEVLNGFEVVRNYAFDVDDEILIGRSDDADIQLESNEVSRKHALVLGDGHQFTVRDLSRNGLTHEGRRLPNGAWLPCGATVEIGPFTLVLGQYKEDTDEDINLLRSKILNRLIDHMDLASIDRRGHELRPRVEAALERIAYSIGVPSDVDMAGLVKELADEALGLGPLEQLLADDSVSEIMVINPTTIFAERRGRLERTDLSFTSEKAVRTIVERIITPLGRRIDESSAMVDARLADGSRVNVVIPPLAIGGANITIRKFTSKTLGFEDLIRLGSMNQTMADFLCRAVAACANIIISGGTGSGKTTLLNMLSSAIPETERIITIEDAAELRLSQTHVVTLESRPSNAEGKGEVTIRDLVRNALRMRPDRIVVGECRGGEALDMLQAMNTGHDGSLTTLHANSPVEAISRLETLCLMAGLDLPARAIREQIAQAIDLIVQQSRLADGSRRITSIVEVSRIEEDGSIRLNEIFRFIVRDGTEEGGVFLATGWLPSCAGDAVFALGASHDGASR